MSQYDMISHTSTPVRLGTAVSTNFRAASEAEYGNLMRELTLKETSKGGRRSGLKTWTKSTKAPNKRNIATWIKRREILTAMSGDPINAWSIIAETGYPEGTTRHHITSICCAGFAATERIKNLSYYSLTDAGRAEIVRLARQIEDAS